MNPNCITEVAMGELALMIVGKAAGNPRIGKLQDHIASCDECSRRYSKHLGLVRGLDRVARGNDDEDGRGGCLDENYLAEFVDDVLSEDDREATIHHLAQCHVCVSKLSDLQSCLQDVKSSMVSYVFKRVKGGFESLLHPKSGFTLMSHEPAMVLDAAVEEAIVCSWTQVIHEYSIRFDLQELEQGLFSLQLTISPMESPSGQNRLVLRVDGNIIQAGPLPESGTIRLDGLAAQSYELEIVFPDESVGPFELTIE